VDYQEGAEQMSETVLRLPIPPSANKYWTYGNGRVFTSPEAAEYKNEVRTFTRCEILTGDIVLNLTVFRPRKSGDLDNYLKIMLDALQGILYENDKQVVEIHAYRDDDPEDPHVILTAWEKANE